MCRRVRVLAHRRLPLDARLGDTALWARALNLIGHDRIQRGAAPGEVAVCAVEKARRAVREIRAEGATEVVGNGLGYLAAYSCQLAHDIGIAMERVPRDSLADPLECLDKVRYLQLIEWNTN